MSLKLSRIFDTSHPAVHKDTQKSLLFHIGKTKAPEEDEENAFAIEDEKKLEQVKDLKSRIKQLSSQIQEKRRGYFHKKIDYPRLRNSAQGSTMNTEPSLAGPKNEEVNNI